MTIRYYIPELDMGPEDAWSFDTRKYEKPNTKLGAAELAAEDYHHCHDGWEHKSWPIVFMVAWRERQEHFEAVSVEREVCPNFVARGI